MAAGDYVVYDYSNLDAIVADLRAANSNATLLLATATANRATLALTWQGASQVSFDEAFSRFALSSTNIIDATAQAIAALLAGYQDMEATEANYAAGFE